jgi:hypothetical protein
MGERPKVIHFEVPFYGEHGAYQLDDRQAVDNYEMRRQGLKPRHQMQHEKLAEYEKYREHFARVVAAYESFREE